MVRKCLQRIDSEEFRRWLVELLVEICKVDTTPSPDVARMREAESAVFDVLQRELERFPFERARCERRPVNPSIAAHPAFSKLHFTKTPERPEGLSPEETYAGRSNLLFLVDGETETAESGLALNAHIDVVAPYFPPRVENGVVFGRGACDDKGNVVAMLGALRAAAECLAEQGRSVLRPLTGMFVIEEETGGNGSLSLAVDRELKQRYDSLLVLECCGNRFFPANRGAVWYQFELKATQYGLNDLELAALVVEELEREGRAIRAESRHRLFPQRPVQTCQGILDRYGEHPSRICGEMAFQLEWPQPPTPETLELVRDVLEFGLQEYVALYGDKTKTLDPETGRPKVERHYDWELDSNRLVIRVYGSTGHMGAIFENDDAITKAMWLVRAVMASRRRLEQTAGGPIQLDVFERRDKQKLVLEGGQGFVPTHPLEEIMERMLEAARRGAARFLWQTGRPDLSPEQLVVGSYDKLHNDAFDGNPDAPFVQEVATVAEQCGLWDRRQPICGWTVSCDARLFAKEYPDLTVVTAGAGRLEDAHSDHEHLNVDELVRCVQFLTLLILRKIADVKM